MSRLVKPPPVRSAKATPLNLQRTSSLRTIERLSRWNTCCGWNVGEGDPREVVSDRLPLNGGLIRGRSSVKTVWKSRSLGRVEDDARTGWENNGTDVGLPPAVGEFIKLIVCSLRRGYFNGESVHMDVGWFKMYYWDFGKDVRWLHTWRSENYSVLGF